MRNVRRGFFAFLCIALIALGGCSSGSTSSATSQTSTSGDFTSGTLVLSLNEGFDFGLDREVSTVGDADVYVLLVNNIPTLRFNEWATLTNQAFDSVTSVNPSVTPKLTAVTASDLMFHLPNVTILSKNADGNYLKLSITDIDGVVATETGYTYDTNDFSFTLNFMMNRTAVPEF